MNLKDVRLGGILRSDAQSISCNCVGPRIGEPVCPCRMGRLKNVNGRWVETIDHGPVIEFRKEEDTQDDH